MQFLKIALTKLTLILIWIYFSSCCRDGNYTLNVSFTKSDDACDCNGFNKLLWYEKTVIYINGVPVVDAEIPLSEYPAYYPMSVDRDGGQNITCV